MKASFPKKQQGSMLLEALIAILIFSMGILAIVGMQAASIRQVSDGKYRTDAALLVDELIGQMWVSDRTPATLQTAFATGGAGYDAWKANVQAALPGATGANVPTVTVAQVAAVAPATSVTSLVTIQVYWVAPGDTTRHNHIAITNIR